MMHILSKPRLKQETSVAVLGQDWEGLAPQPFELLTLLDDQPSDGELQSALRQAETVIQAQEERIRVLESMALTDELTGLANRRGFSAAFERELALARRNSDNNGILIMVDLDAFKAINDKWGHQVGDAYLCAVAKVLQESVRTSDTVARLGGDEFALVMPGMDEQAGAKRVAKIEQAFNKRSLILHERLPLRASFGFAPYAGTDYAETVLRAADVRLYAHKARNKKITA